MTTENNVRITIESILCEQTTKINNVDEVFLRYRTAEDEFKRYPKKGSFSMSPGQKRQLEVSFAYNSNFLVEFFRMDEAGQGSQILGMHEYTRLDAALDTRITWPINGDNSSYRVSSVGNTQETL